MSFLFLFRFISSFNSLQEKMQEKWWFKCSGQVYNFSSMRETFCFSDTLPVESSFYFIFFVSVDSLHPSFSTRFLTLLTNWQTFSLSVWLVYGLQLEGSEGSFLMKKMFVVLYKVLQSVCGFLEDVYNSSVPTISGALNKSLRFCMPNMNVQVSPKFGV